MVSVFAFVAVVYGINLAGAERFLSLLLLLWCMALTLLALSHPSQICVLEISFWEADMCIRGESLETGHVTVPMRH